MTGSFPDAADSASRRKSLLVTIGADGVNVSTLAEHTARQGAMHKSLAGTSTIQHGTTGARGLQHCWRLTGGIPSELVEQLEARGFISEHHRGTSPWMRCGVDTEAIAFLDGGISVAAKDGFVPGGLNGCSVVGDAAMAWVCGARGYQGPRSASRSPAAVLESRLGAQRGLATEVLRPASKALLCSTVAELAAAQTHVPTLLGWS